jgi:hypothetical protein
MSHTLIPCKVRTDAEQRVEHRVRNKTVCVLSEARAGVEETVELRAHNTTENTVFSVRRELRLKK